jgi:hypothetical protein
MVTVPRADPRDSVLFIVGKACYFASHTGQYAFRSADGSINYYFSCRWGRLVFELRRKDESTRQATLHQVVHGQLQFDRFNRFVEQVVTQFTRLLA